MTHVGIDFSLNSPGICIQDTRGYHFISFFNFGKRTIDLALGKDIKIPKAFQVHFELKEADIIHTYPYNREVISKAFLYREREKMLDASNIANTICTVIELYSPHKIYLEGFSYGSRGNSFIDIIQYNSFLRKDLVTIYGKDNISIFQPSHVKKTAGKGNGNKHFMIKAFQDNVLDDDSLTKTDLWNWVQGKDYSEKIPKPLDDLVDAYFILRTGILNATS